MYTLLVAEDTPDHREVLTMLLRRSGYRVVEATTGYEAIDVALRERPDLILMDLSLPELNGWEATRRLRTRPELANTPIIAVSAHALPENAEEARAAGCDDYITKPIALAAFLRLIERHLQVRDEPTPGLR
jgi:two-component system cell cycle response regulator DivK